ncbi:MAG: TolC family outer membrane protein [Magnetococcales bacterium]|nr:TolC family outer membrane protein [Magnetococcales bacterium]
MLTQTLKRALPVLFIGGLIPFSSVHGQTIDEAIQHALGTNPDVVAARKNQDAVKQQITQAKATYLPRLDLSAGYGREYTDIPSHRAAVEKGLTLNRGESGITLTQTIFDGLGTVEDIKRAKAQYESASFGFDRTAESVVAQATNAYLETLKRRELLELVKDNVLLHQRILSKVRKKADSGAGNQADVQQTESRLALASANHAAAQGAMRQAKIRFERVIGASPQTLTRPVMPTGKLPATLEEAIQSALSGHPAILASQADLKSAEAQHAGSLANFMPSVDLELSASNNANVSGTQSYQHTASAMLQFSYNLFNGGGDWARRKETRQRVAQNQALLDQARMNTIQEVSTAWDVLQVARERVKYLSRHLDVSKEVTAAYHNQFKIGKRTLLDVLNSETELYSAHSALTTEEFNELNGTYKLWAAMGNLRDALSLLDGADTNSDAQNNAAAETP